MIVDFSDNRAMWRNFGFQNTYEPEIRGQHLIELGPFEFDLEEYTKTLNAALDKLNS